MSIICNVEHMSNSFTWTAKTKTLVAEASDFNGKILDGRVYNDSCDTGFYVRSIRSGNLMLFALWEVEYADEGDIISWNYRPVNKKDHQLIEQVVIFND